MERAGEPGGSCRGGASKCRSQLHGRYPIVLVVDIMLLPGSRKLYTAPGDSGAADPLAVGASSANFIPGGDSGGQEFGNAAMMLPSTELQIPAELQALCKGIRDIRKQSPEVPANP